MVVSKRKSKFSGGLPGGEGTSNIRIEAIGARPTAFSTVRYSEKILESTGISVITVDLSDVFGEARKLADDDSRVKARPEEIHAHADASSVPPPSMVLMGKPAVVISDWIQANSINAAAIQCWSQSRAISA
jgi:L-fucose isomerase-like protein